MKKLASLSVAFTVGMAVLLLPTLALAQAIHVEHGDTAELTGAGVVVPVTVACVDDSTNADVVVRLRQANTEGGATTFAGGEGDLPLQACDSTPQTVHVLVPYTGRMELGRAAATAELDACDSTHDNCNRLIDTPGIQIVD
jgi:hypothetical protein